jgi:hypothetical protein
VELKRRAIALDMGGNVRGSRLMIEEDKDMADQRGVRLSRGVFQLAVVKCEGVHLIYFSCNRAECPNDDVAVNSL